jgi:hypothetical protein
VLVPLALTLGGWLAHFPHGLIVVGIIIILAAAFVSIAVVGSWWQRPGAAVLVAITGFALPFFIGPALYIVYMEELGDRVPAVVTKVENRDARRGADWYCTVVETTGDRTAHEISQQQNCFGQIKPMEKISLRKDPLGLLKPRLPDRPGESDTLLSVLISAGLLAANAATLLYGGLRRKDKKVPTARPPRRAARVEN